MLSQVVLKPRKQHPLAPRHPWVLDSSLEQVVGRPADGDSVELVSDKGKFLGRGLYNSHSRIRVRLYTWDRNEPIDAALWRRRLETAVALRRVLRYDDPAGAARLVFSEGDGLSGLIVDRYARWLSVQVTAKAIQSRLPEILPSLVDLVQPEGVLLRTERMVAKSEGMEVRDGLLWGTPPSGPVAVEDRGLRFEIDIAEGQKTGFYLDQRENRRAAAAYMAGRRVLDVFCYHGGFSLAAALWGQASECLGIDSSAAAIEQARANARLNGLANVQFEEAEAFPKLQRLAEAGQRFGCVVLDPPKFARTRHNLDEALRAYHWLNRLGMSLLEPGGILVTCSCSGLVRREDFFQMLLGAAHQADRPVQVLEQRGASPDHPVPTTCPESEYLKCFICRVG